MPGATAVWVRAEVIDSGLRFGKIAMMIKARLSNRPNPQTYANIPSLIHIKGTSIGLSLLLSAAILILLASFLYLRNVHRTTLDIPKGRVSLGTGEAGGNGIDENRAGMVAGRDDSGTQGIPFGLWELHGEARAMWGTKYTAGTIWTSPETILGLLEEAQAKGMHVVISLSSFSKSHYQNPDGTFSLSLWKARVDRYRGINLDEYINDGTIIVHYLVDEPKWPSGWGGQVIPNDVLDEMARYSKEIWPNMLTAVRATPVTLETHAGGYQVPLPSWTWKYLDTAWLQYSSRKGDINRYIEAENQSAIRQRLGLIVGLQALTGGDGSSGIPGPPPGYTSASAMSKDELLKYGTPLINFSSSCAFLMWTYMYDLYPSYNYVYFNRPDIEASVVTLKQLAGQRPWRSCKFEDHPLSHNEYLPLLGRR